MYTYEYIKGDVSCFRERNFHRSSKPCCVQISSNNTPAFIMLEAVAHPRLRIKGASRNGRQHPVINATYQSHLSADILLLRPFSSVVHSRASSSPQLSTGHKLCDLGMFGHRCSLFSGRCGMIKSSVALESDELIELLSMSDRVLCPWVVLLIEKPGQAVRRYLAIDFRRSKRMQCQTSVI